MNMVTATVISITVAGSPPNFNDRREIGYTAITDITVSPIIAEGRNHLGFIVLQNLTAPRQVFIMLPMYIVNMNPP